MKKIITVICAASLLVSLTGCNKETASNGGTSPSIPKSTSSESMLRITETTAIKVSAELVSIDDLGKNLPRLPNLGCGAKKFSKYCQKSK